MLQYQHSYIEPVKGKFDAWFTMHAGELINIELKLDKNSLAFLLTDHPMTWRAVVLEETRFSVLKDAVDHRNKLINDSVWPKMEAKGIGHEASIEVAKIEEILGPATTQNLKNLTQFIIDSSGKNIESISTCIANLRQALLHLYPSRDFVRPPKRLVMSTNNAAD